MIRLREQRDAESLDLVESDTPWWSFLVRIPSSAPVFAEGPNVSAGDDSVIPEVTIGAREEGIRVDLTNWWAQVPTPEELAAARSPGKGGTRSMAVDPTITSTDEIEWDPLGSALMMYWLDEDGYVCHGTPGVSGQPGVIVIQTARISNFSRMIREATRVSDSLVADIQDDVYLLTKEETWTEEEDFMEDVGWGGETHSSVSTFTDTGEYLFQFGVQYWRQISTGLLYKMTLPRLSLPVDATLTDTTVSPSFFQPVSTAGLRFNDCYSRDEGLMRVPRSDLDVESQHPTRCFVKQDVSAFDLAIACEEGRLEGSFYDGYFNIIPRPEPEPEETEEESDSGSPTPGFFARIGGWFGG